MTATGSTNITTASREWATRPDDQRFLTLDELEASVAKRREESWTAAPELKQLRVVTSNAPGGESLPENDIGLSVYDPTHGENRLLQPTNWSFTQLAGYAGAPASYLRKLPADLAAINLQWGLETEGRKDALVLAQSNGDNHLRAVTSTSYGRIWDLDVVKGVQKVNADGRWEIPAASYTTKNPKRATTLYASDRDVFIFLVDPKNPIEVAGEQMFRGFYTWNSEVGSATFGLTTFLYRFICDNRIIWGATDVNELRIRHTGGAPERFAYEGEKYLRKYAEEGTEKIAKAITAAKAAEVPLNKKDSKSTVASWLQSRGFTKTEATASVASANAEEGQARSLWDVINGVTAYARSLPHTDDRVTLEAKAGKILDLVA